MRAVWACVILTAGYFLIVGLLSLFSERLASQADILFFLDVTALAAAVYLITRPQLKYRLFGAGAAALSVFLRLTSGVVTGSGVLMRLRRFTVWELLDYSARIVHWRQVARPLLAAGLTVGAALLISLLCKRMDRKPRTRLAAAVTGSVYMLFSILRTLPYYIGIPSDLAVPQVTDLVLYGMADGACILLMCMALYALCTSPAKVRLRTFGVIWACFAIAGAAVALVVNGVRFAGSAAYPIDVTSIALYAAVLAGYVLLLFGRRAGLYVILIGGGTLLGTMAVSALYGVLVSLFMGYGNLIPQLMTFLVCCVYGVMLLAAWLICRCALRERAQARPRG